MVRVKDWSVGLRQTAKHVGSLRTSVHVITRAQFLRMNASMTAYCQAVLHSYDVPDNGRT